MRFSSLVSLVGQIAVGAALPSADQVLDARLSGPSAFASNSDGSLKLSPIDAPVQGNGNPGSSTWELSIDDTSSGYKQTVKGFGATVTDATVASFNSLSGDKLSSLLNELMTTAGANFAFMRHTIASSDLSGDPAYTYDDNGGNDDPDMSGFNLGGRGYDMADLMARMKSLQPSLTILGSPWSAPGWMKLNNQLTGTTDQNNLDDGYLTNNGPRFSQAFADYFVNYIRAYESRGAPIDAITLQNEPLNSKADYPTMYMFSYEQAQLVQNYVGPALANAGLGTKIMAYDHNTDHPEYPQDVLNGAGQYVNSVAWHCYNGPDWSVLTDFRNSNPGVEQYMTECWTPSSGPYDANWNHAADFTMGPMQNWAAGVAAWTLGTNGDNGPYLSSGGCHSCTGLVTVANGDYYFQTAYYMMAQFSKFMPPGATVLHGEHSYTYPDGGGVQSVASLNPDGTRSVVIENTFGNDIYIHLHTSSGQTWSGNVPASSVTTWVLPPN